MVGQANKSAQELMDFPHVNQHSGPPVSLLSNEAKEKTVGGGGNDDGREGRGTSCIQRRFSLVAER